MTISCPNCGVAGPNLNCNLHPMPNFGNMTNPCKEIPQPLIDEEKRWLFAETARLSLRLRAVELHAHTMEAKVSELEAAGIIDHMGRKLPLPDHHKDCGHGQNGWAMCTCPKGRPSPLAESVTKAFQQAAADAVGTTLDRGGTAVGEVHGQWQVVSKTCEHGNTECQKCGVGQPAPTIKTPQGKPLLPAMEFAVARIQDNMSRGQSECNFRRCTGRTTARVIEALEFVKQNNSALVVIEVHNLTMKKHIKELLKHYADELGVQHNQVSRVRVRDPEECSPSADQIAAAGSLLTLRDNVLDDMKEIKPTRAHRQNLKAGDRVQFEVEGIIKERWASGFKDLDGNDLEPVQYVVQMNVARSYYLTTLDETPVALLDVTGDQIIKVIGMEE